MKLMSLFDGSGGFPLAASLCGIEPVYASEVEPYPIAVTKSRFPNMKHLGDVSRIKGADIEPVDIITFGSPCQDMSVAGKRAGLKHTAVGDEETTRSGLFMEAIRIIKEMRVKTNGIYPRFAVWENVPGAFSSNRGEDFRLVLEEFIKITEPDAVMPAVPQAGWAYADCISGDGWSLAYRVFDAQYWGVPQRRRRIYLVADFRGECAQEILFKRESLRGYFEAGRTPWQGIAADAQNCVGADDSAGESGSLIAFAQNQRNEIRDLGEKAGCIQAEPGMKQQTFIVENIEVQGFDKFNQCLTGEVQNTLRTPGGGDNYAAVVVAFETGIASRVGGHIYENVAGTLRANAGDNRLAIVQPISDGSCSTLFENHRQDCRYKGPLKVAPTLTAGYGMGGNNTPFVVSGRETSATVHCYGGGSENIVVKNYLVRRLTPTECARLQGFPDLWGHPDYKENLTDEEFQFWLAVRNTHAAINGKQTKEYTKPQILTWYNKLHTDSSEYKMWGNGIALPNALYVMQGIAAEAEIPIKYKELEI